MTSPRTVRIEINGVAHEAAVEPRRTLADFVREDCHLTGTHLGCEQGLCGSCTVLVDGTPVRSCLMFAVQAEGASVRTIEGLSQGGELGAVPQAFSDEHGLQCGFCTPGMLMATQELLEREPVPDDDAIHEALSGNLCRCTGYQGIRAAVRAAARARAAAVGTPSTDAASNGDVA